MSESKLRTQSMDFAVSIINLVKGLKQKKESIRKAADVRNTYFSKTEKPGQLAGFFASCAVFSWEFPGEMG